MALSVTAVVTRPVANMYSSPSEDADVVSQAIYGSNVGLLEQRGGWAKVRTADEYQGWVSDAALRRSEKPYATSGRVAQVQSLFANLYREASATKHAPLVVVPFETRLEVIAEPEMEQGRWIEVRLPDDRAAWVQRGDITFSPAVLSIEESINLGKRFLGMPYFWGGTSSFGYDCSGFTQMLCRRRGVSLPRDAGPQAQSPMVMPVSREDLKPGDLLYFGSKPGKITHTGMYIGDGKFIHASTYEHPVVQVGELSNPHWAEEFQGARRVK